MKKKVLAIYYSQSGQLLEIIEKIASTFSNDYFEFDWVSIKMQQEFPFPWSSKTFYDAMPDSVLGNPVPLAPMQFAHEKYDLVLFAYQPWFLSPSIPTTSILLDKKFISIIRNTPLITIIGSRNMWISAHQRVSKLLKEANALHVGNIVLEDKATNLISAITIQYWMYTGKKDKMFGVLPKPGISKTDIEKSKMFGEIISKHFLANTLSDLQSDLVKAKAVVVHPNLMFIESRGALLFKIWAKNIITKTNRAVWLKFFEYYLTFAVFVLSPIVVLLYVILYRPFANKIITLKQKKYLYL